MKDKQTRIITVSSGKGGVGKTNISLNMALELGRSGNKTCLFDADLGLANINILLGLTPDYTLEDVIDNRCGLQDILIRDYQGIDIVPGSSGVARMADLNPEQVEPLIQELGCLDVYDFIVFDTSAGIATNIISFCLAARELVLVIVPEPTSLTDAYSLLKVMSKSRFDGTVKIVVNRCKSIPSAKKLYVKFRDTVKANLSLKVTLLGIIFDDPKVAEAIVKQRPLVYLFPKCNAATCLNQLAGKLISQEERGFDTNDLGSFWRRCLQIMKGKLRLPIKKKDEKDIKVQSPQEPATPEMAGHQQSEAAAPHISPVQAEINDGKSISDQRISILMERLIHGVASVSEELQMIRRTMEGGKSHNPRAQSDSSNIKPIHLDMDAFLKRQENGKKRTL